MSKSVVVCRQCSDHLGRPYVQPFEDEDKRREYMRVHAEGRHEVKAVPGWPPLAEAWTRAFGGVKP